MHNLDFLKKELSNDNPAKKAQTHDKLNVGKHPMLRLYKKYKLGSKSFLFTAQIHKLKFKSEYYLRINMKSSNPTLIYQIMTIWFLYFK